MIECILVQINLRSKPEKEARIQGQTTCRDLFKKNKLF